MYMHMHLCFMFWSNNFSQLVVLVKKMLK